jgi:hypothetical protein
MESLLLLLLLRFMVEIAIATRLPQLLMGEVVGGCGTLSRSDSGAATTVGWLLGRVGVTGVEAGFVLVRGGGGCGQRMVQEGFDAKVWKSGGVGPCGARYWKIRSTCWTSPEVLHPSF